MKKMKFESLACSLMVCGLLLAPASALAAPISAGSAGDITFQQDEDGETPIVDPEKPDPEKPVNPTEPEITKPETKGALRIDGIANFRFGNNKMTSTEQNYYPNFVKQAAGEKDLVHFAQITDERGGTATTTKGWSLSVAHDGIFETSDKSSSFTGGFTLDNITVASASGITDLAKAPTAKSVENGVQLTSTPVTLMEAKGAQGQGYGIWSMAIGSTDVVTTGLGKDGNQTEGAKDDNLEGRNPAVKLTIPKGQIMEENKQYKTTLNWVLADAL